MRNHGTGLRKYLILFGETVLNTACRYVYLMPFTAFWLLVLASLYSGTSLTDIFSDYKNFVVALKINSVVTLTYNVLKHTWPSGHRSGAWHVAGRSAGTRSSRN